MYLLHQVAGIAPMIPLDDKLRPKWLSARPSTRDAIAPAITSRAIHQTTARRNASSNWAAGVPVVNCNVPKRGWMNGMGGCPNLGGICIGCTMPGFPDKFMPFMDEPPGARVLAGTIGRFTGSAVRGERCGPYAERYRQ